MKSVWLLWEVGKGRLQEAGLLVDIQAGIMYVYNDQSNFPDRLSIKDGRVSEKSVKRLIKEYGIKP